MKDDTISRAAAIDAMMKLQAEDIEAYGASIPEGFDGDRAVTALKALPSATDTNVGGNLIDREAALDVLHGYFDGMLETDTVCPKDLYNEIEALPSAQPGWIPCDRELPKPNEEDGNGFYKAYLVQDGRWMDVARWDGKYWIAWGYSTVLLNVVAWMPLPAPYIPEGDDKHEG